VAIIDLIQKRSSGGNVLSFLHYKEVTVFLSFVFFKQYAEFVDGSQPKYQHDHDKKENYVFSIMD
jgi:hypothetical protein